MKPDKEINIKIKVSNIEHLIERAGEREVASEQTSARSVAAGRETWAKRTKGNKKQKNMF